MTLQRSGYIQRKPTRPRAWCCRHCLRKNLSTKKKCQGCGIGRATKRTSLKARADAMARELCRLLADGKCARCGGPGSDWAHRLPRKHHAVRWSMDNCDFLCRPCHRFFSDRPIAFAFWLDGKYGREAMEALQARGNERWDGSYERVLAELSAALQRAKEKAA